MVSTLVRICQAILALCILHGMNAKKPVRKKAQQARTVVARRAKLEKELRSAIEEVDDKGLLFLLRQAQVLIHNARLESLGESGSEEHGALGAAPSARPSDSVEIEDARDGKAIFLTIGRTRKVLAPEEMKRLVRICYGAETKSEALRQLFTVLVKERKDILTDAMIGSPDSPLMAELFTVVRANYRLEDR
jgi:hypothetical protein